MRVLGWEVVACLLLILAGSCGSTKLWEGAVSPSSALRNSHRERMNSMPLKASLMFVGPHLRESSRVSHPFLHWYSTTKPRFFGALDYQRQSVARALDLRMTLAADSGSGNPDMMMLLITAKDQTISMLTSSHREVIAKADQAIAAKDEVIAQAIAKADEVIAKADQAIAAKDEAIAKANEVIAAKDQVIAAKDEVIAAKELAHFANKKEMARELVKHMAILDDRLALEICAYGFMNLMNVTGLHTASQGVKLIRDSLIFQNGTTTKLSANATEAFKELKRVQCFEKIRKEDFEKFCRSNDPYNICSGKIHYPKFLSQGFYFGDGNDAHLRLFLALSIVLCQQAGCYEYEPAALIDNDQETIACILEKGNVTIPEPKKEILTLKYHSQQKCVLYIDIEADRKDKTATNANRRGLL